MLIIVNQVLINLNLDIISSWFSEFYYISFLLRDYIKTNSYFFIYIINKNVYQMDSNIVYIPRFELLTCPFIDTCELPKLQFLCKIPECKNCTDYIEKAKKLKHRVLF